MMNQNRIAKDTELLLKMVFEGNKKRNPKTIHNTPILLQFANINNWYKNKNSNRTSPAIAPDVK